MRRKQYGPEEIVTILREAKARLAQGKTVEQVCSRLGISQQSYYRWYWEFAGATADQARRLRELEKENALLHRTISDLTVTNQFLKEALGES